MNFEEPVKTMQYGQLKTSIYESEAAMGRAAALVAQDIINKAILKKGEANVILATGNSQLAFLRSLREQRDVEWSKVRVFHMDEYVGIDPNHRASFPRFLKDHFFDFVEVKEFYPISSQVENVQQACQEYEALLKKHEADLVAVGWGENGHLAFNDPPDAKFDDPVWVKVVKLAETSRKQQVGEGHFDSLEDVPTHAITLTVPALLAAKRILCIVPEARKAEAVRACLEEPISEERPGSILRQVDHAYLYLDKDSASKLRTDLVHNLAH